MAISNSSGNRNYQKTLFACYLGFITQAISANFAPLLFLTFHKAYGIPLGQIALISTTFFLTQLLVDLFCAKFVDRIGYRKCVVASEVLSALGLVGLAFLPGLFSRIFASGAAGSSESEFMAAGNAAFMGILISVVIYAIGSGLIEVLVSPIVEACPFENKDSVMSLLHSFYCWGSVGVILLSTLFFKLFGMDRWPIVACFWALIPLYNTFNFLSCPIERLTDEDSGLTITKLLKIPMFWIAILLMVCAGASELSMAQWASAYVESALGFSKSLGDLAGPCLFAVSMGICRVFYGKFGEKMDLLKFMLVSGILCLTCYLLAAVSANPVFGLIGCILCGFSVGIMWPGTISISSARIPLGGTAMFALLAMAGDLGGAAGPAIVGMITQNSGDNLKNGMLAGSVFPLVLIVAVGLLLISQRKYQDK